MTTAIAVSIDEPRYQLFPTHDRDHVAAVGVHNRHDLIERRRPAPYGTARERAADRPIRAYEGNRAVSEPRSQALDGLLPSNVAVGGSEQLDQRAVAVELMREPLVVDKRDEGALVLVEDRDAHEG